jgi:hypothetical protein
MDNKFDGKKVNFSYSWNFDENSCLLLANVCISPFVGLCTMYLTIWKLGIFGQWNFICKQNFDLIYNNRFILSDIRTT